MSNRVKCVECDNMILLQTAAENGGLCGQCKRIPAEIRQRKHEHSADLDQGSLFVPDESELDSASTPHELSANDTVWKLNAEFYAGQNINSPAEAIAAAKSEPQGNVFLVSYSGGALNLGFTESYGVCEYQNQEAGDYRYAYSILNLREQVSRELHVVQACACCGVGMLWYPSRFHMPRQHALSLVESILLKKMPENINWFDAHAVRAEVVISNQRANLHGGPTRYNLIEKF